MQKGEWVKEITKPQEAKGLIGEKEKAEAQWVVTHSGLEYDTVELQVKMLLHDGSILYGACGNPGSDFDDPIAFPSFLEMPAEVVEEGEDSWLPLGIEVACVLGGRL